MKKNDVNHFCYSTLWPKDFHNFVYFNRYHQHIAYLLVVNADFHLFFALKFASCEGFVVSLNFWFLLASGVINEGGAAWTSANLLLGLSGAATTSYYLFNLKAYFCVKLFPKSLKVCFCNCLFYILYFESFRLLKNLEWGEWNSLYILDRFWDAMADVWDVC